ncbi:MAG: OmpA family protein, partial [Alphaproteobacteria bacterium]
RRFVLYFVSGTTELTAESQAELPEVERTAADRVAPRVDVIGHSDRVGAAPLNALLSRDRAQSVADLLVGVGVPAAAIRVDSFGEADNAVPTADGVAEPLNRRVEIVVR